MWIDIGSIMHVGWSPLSLYKYNIDQLIGAFCTTQQTRYINTMLNQYWTTVYDAGPTLDQQWVDVSYLLGSMGMYPVMFQYRTSFADSDPALKQHCTINMDSRLHSTNKLTIAITFKQDTSIQCCFNVGPASQTVIPQQTQNICITFIQRRLNVLDVGTTLYKCYTNVLCLLGQHESNIETSQSVYVVRFDKQISLYS